MPEKKKILIHRLVWAILLGIGIILPIMIAYTIAYTESMSDFVTYYVFIFFFVFADTIFFAFFIASLLLSYKVYDYNGTEISIYAGIYHHYIKVNGEKTDEHNTVISFTAIPLSCTLDDGTDIQATITLTNRISMKINNKLYTKTK